jgi:hypothetical protein
VIASRGKNFIQESLMALWVASKNENSRLGGSLQFSLLPAIFEGEMSWD